MGSGSFKCNGFLETGEAEYGSSMRILIASAVVGHKLGDYSQQQRGDD